MQTPRPARKERRRKRDADLAQLYRELLELERSWFEKSQDEVSKSNRRGCEHIIVLGAVARSMQAAFTAADNAYGSRFNHHKRLSWR